MHPKHVEMIAYVNWIDVGISVLLANWFPDPHKIKTHLTFSLNKGERLEQLEFRISEKLQQSSKALFLTSTEYSTIYWTSFIIRSNDY